VTAPEKPRVRVRLTSSALGSHAAGNYMDVGADAVTFDRGELVLWLLGSEQASFALGEVAALELPDVAALLVRSSAGKAYTLDEKRAHDPNAYKPWTSKEDERLLARHPRARTYTH
jgi:hypothetical protein